MTDGAMPYLLLFGACLSLIGLGLSGVLVTRSQAATDRRAKRMAAILTPHLRTTQIELSAFTVQDDRGPRSAPAMFSGLFGFSFERQALYPAKWA